MPADGNQAAQLRWSDHRAFEECLVQICKIESVALDVGQRFGSSQTIFIYDIVATKRLSISILARLPYLTAIRDCPDLLCS